MEAYSTPATPHAPLENPDDLSPPPGRRSPQQSRVVIAILQFEVLIHGAESLKDKRRVVKSIKDRLHREHMVSVAEVAMQESLGVGRLALAAVCMDDQGGGRRAGEVLDTITAKLRSMAAEAGGELGAVSRQVLHGSQLPDGGEGEEAPATLDEDALAKEMLERFDAPE